MAQVFDIVNDFNKLSLRDKSISPIKDNLVILTNPNKDNLVILTNPNNTPSVNKDDLIILSNNTTPNKDERKDQIIYLDIQPEKYRILDLFTGTGGFSFALESLGKFETILANDCEKISQTFFSENLSAKFWLEDIINIKVEHIPKVDIITAGFPCQPFSIAGNQLGFQDPRSNVFWKLLEIIKYCRPKVFILENVKNLQTHDKGQTFKIIESQLTNFEPRYFLRSQVINTCQVTDIPQNRERIFIVGFLDEEKAKKFSFPSITNKRRPITDFLDKKVDSKYYYDSRFKCFGLIQSYVTKHISTNTVYQYRRTVVRENKGGVCPTLTANAGTGGHNVPLILDDYGIRKLTPFECFRLQGFPENLKFPNINDSSLYKLAGNAITVSIVQKIGANLLSCGF